MAALRLFVLVTSVSIQVQIVLSSASKSCPCRDISLCNPVESYGNEVFAFVLPSKRSVWENFDWQRITTIALFGFVDSDLVCYAHEHRVKVVPTVNFPYEQLLNESFRKQWIQDQLAYVKDNFMDGINIDFESEIAKNSPQVDALSSLVKETSKVFHERLNNSQVSFDVPWSPKNEKGTGVDGRNYDFVALAEASDFLFVMSYDIQSQMLYGNDSNECYARSNGAILDTAGGIFAYLQLGIKAEKLVLGQPWYGYDYECLTYGDFYQCKIKEVPFRGVNCSDAAGKQMCFSQIQEILATNGTEYIDAHSRSPYVLYKDNEQKIHQIWYDDKYSLSRKYMFALTFGLRGIGIWNANCVDYTNKKQAKEMWSTLPNYKDYRWQEGSNICFKLFT